MSMPAVMFFRPALDFSRLTTSLPGVCRRRHEVDAQSKTVIRHAMQMLSAKPGDPAWQQLNCDVMHQQLPANCAADVEPGLAGGVDGYVPMCPGTALSGSFFTVLTGLSCICVGIHSRGVLPSPICA